MARILASGSGVAVLVNRDRNTAVLRESTARVTVRDRRTVNTIIETPSVVAIAAPGPRGPAGAAGGTSESRYASEILGGHRMVRSTGAGTCGYASSDQAGHGDDTIGMTLGAVIAGDSVEVQRVGPVTFAGWSWTPEEPVFLGTNGLPTQTEPLTGFVQVIGHAEAPTVLYLAIEPPVYYED